LGAVLVSTTKPKIDMRELVEYIGELTGFDKRDIEEILQAEREYLIKNGIKEEDK